MIKKRTKKCESCSLAASKLNRCMTCGQEKTMQAKVAVVMREFKEEKLHSGSKTGPLVTNPKQAIAIALSEGRKAAGVPQVKIKKSR